MNCDITELASATIVFRLLKENVKQMSKDDAIAKFAEITPVIQKVTTTFDYKSHPHWNVCVDQLRNLKNATNYTDELWSYMNILFSLSYAVGIKTFEYA